MVHDHPSTGPDDEIAATAIAATAAATTEDSGAALHLFTLLAVELLLGAPPATADHPTPDEPTAPQPLCGQRGDRYRARPDAEQRDFAQAVLRVVSALAHLGATARARTATGSPSPSHLAPAQAATPQPRPQPWSQRTAADRRRRRWLTAAAVLGALTLACRSRRDAAENAACPN